MDPDKALERIIESARFVLGGSATDPLEESAEELAQQVLDLDGWLRRGGFPPRAWHRRNAVLPEKRHAELERACRGLLQDIGEVLERQGEAWWDETVTSGTHHRQVAERLTGKEVKPYHLELNDADVQAIAFVGARYAWSEALLALDVGRNKLDEAEAWRIKEAIESDMVGGHAAFPMLDSRSELYRKLDGFWKGIV